jgi:DNA-binding CsgD family transcriptional regulator
MSSQSRASQPAQPEADDPDRLTALVERYADVHGLSRRERAVLSLGARGLHRKGMATELGCSPGTVNTYWNRILRKLRLSSQAEVLAHLLRLALHPAEREAGGCSEDQDKTPPGRRTNQVES